MRDFKARHGETTNGSASTPTSVPKKATRKRTTPAKGRKKKAASEEDDDDETNDPFADSPLAKKVKRMQEDEEKDVKPDDLGDRKRERRYVLPFLCPAPKKTDCRQCHCRQP